MDDVNNEDFFPAIQTLDTRYTLEEGARWKPHRPGLQIPSNKGKPMDLVPLNTDLFEPSFRIEVPLPELIVNTFGTPVLFRFSVYVTSRDGTLITDPDSWGLTVDASQLLTAPLVHAAYTGTNTPFIRRAIIYFAGQLKRVVPTTTLVVTWKSGIKQQYTDNFLYTAESTAVPLTVGNHGPGEEALVAELIEGLRPQLQQYVRGDISNVTLI